MIHFFRQRQMFRKKSKTPVKPSENQQIRVKKSNVSDSAQKYSTVKSTRSRKVCLPSKYDDFVVDLKYFAMCWHMFSDFVLFH